MTMNYLVLFALFALVWFISHFFLKFISSSSSSDTLCFFCERNNCPCPRFTFERIEGIRHENFMCMKGHNARIHFVWKRLGLFRRRFWCRKYGGWMKTETECHAWRLTWQTFHSQLCWTHCVEALAQWIRCIKLEWFVLGEIRWKAFQRGRFTRWYK